MKLSVPEGNMIWIGTIRRIYEGDRVILNSADVLPAMIRLKGVSYEYGSGFWDDGLVIKFPSGGSWSVREMPDQIPDEWPDIIE